MGLSNLNIKDLQLLNTHLQINGLVCSQKQRGKDRKRQYCDQMDLATLIVIISLNVYVGKYIKHIDFRFWDGLERENHI